jgi:hypothetical protein
MVVANNMKVQWRSNRVKNLYLIPKIRYKIASKNSNKLLILKFKSKSKKR